MIISVADLKNQMNCGTATDEQIAVKLKAIESVIRAYTNNNFQQRGIRFSGYSKDSCVYGVPQNFSVGDTVQISGTLGINDGLYQVIDVADDHLELDEHLAPIKLNLVTRIKYPADVIQCAVDLYKWKQNMGEKVGIKSETLSRHSVTYEDSATLFMGYPVGILNGLNLYKKARC
jgi:hypothetical protein